MNESETRIKYKENRRMNPTLYGEFIEPIWILETCLPVGKNLAAGSKFSVRSQEK
jgi:hypothetical protein